MPLRTRREHPYPTEPNGICQEERRVVDNKKVLKKECGKEYRADRNFWVGMLLLAQKYGWEPEMLRMSYLAPIVHVSTGDAQGIDQALDRLFHTALVAPEQVFPVPLDMGELHQLREFIAGERFAVVD